MPKSDVDRLEQYLGVRNNGLLMSVLGNQEREDLLKASRLEVPQVVVSESQSQNEFNVAPPASRVISLIKIFWNEVGLKPFTIFRLGPF